MTPYLTVVIPLFNEAQNVPVLVEKLHPALSQTGYDYEIVLVDDGSSDDTFDVVSKLAEKDGRLTGIRLRKNFGQAAAIKAGIDHASGDICVTMDGDLQHDPADIGQLLDKLADGHDLVCGYRYKRNDSILRRLPSFVANFMARRISGLPLKDFGSTFRAYKTDLLKQVALYGEMHRFIPILFAQATNRIAEIPITVHPRQFGSSKYGLGRTFRVFSDLLSLLFFSGFFNRPIHIFGYISLFLGLPGFAILAWLSFEKLLGRINIMDFGPLFMLGVMLCLVAVQVFTTGVVCEYLLRIYYREDRPQPYSVAEQTGKTVP